MQFDDLNLPKGIPCMYFGLVYNQPKTKFGISMNGYARVKNHVNDMLFDTATMEKITFQSYIQPQIVEAVLKMIINTPANRHREVVPGTTPEKLFKVSKDIHNTLMTDFKPYYQYTAFDSEELTDKELFTVSNKALKVYKESYFNDTHNNFIYYDE